ncbi:type III secretion system cytoplasmic ring protein SctQ [Parendozoicomonas sp. Alg238-R29]|uniref:type III secretion system cytoplasmic ring protein SctQ n=1 Tax=Parendozoicomonas sp. Alg238-R29 TaxID=2993446 RepID=UPI00248DDA35|nr:type III secretion system cytoplasmic ring protein SctQ [Parendozoicomonas sp. Alg238-R29]
MSIQPFAYKPLSHQQALLNNLVSGSTGQLQSQINGQPCAVSLTPVTAARQFDLEFQISVDGLPVRIQVTRDLFTDMAIGGSPLSDLLEQLPDDLRIGCATMAIDRLLGDLRALLQKDLRLNRVSRSDHIPEGTPCLGVAFQGQSRISSGLLVINDQINSMINTTLGTAQALPADHLAMPLAVEVGHTMLSDTRLGQLATGDIVLLDRSWYKTGKYVFLRMSESTGFIAEISGSRITLKQRVENGMSDDFDDFDDLDDDLDLGDDFDDDLGFSDDPPQDTASQPQQMAPQQTAPQQAAAPTQHVSHQDIQGLPVKLVFDVGNHELTVGEMGRLGPGYTFELNRNIASPVTMKANGKAFAECELVNINNQIGARITKLL